MTTTTASAPRTTPTSGTNEVAFGPRFLRIPYDRTRPPLSATVPLAELKKPRGAGGIERYWSAPYLDAAAVVRWADQHGVPVNAEVRQFADTAWERELKALSRAVAVTIGHAPEPEVTGLTSTLLEQQKVAVVAAATCHLRGPASAGRTHRGLLVADEPGLGKTIIALSALRLTGLERARAIVVCPTSLTANWHAEMAQHFEPETFHPWTAEGITPQPVPADVDVVVIGWEILHAWADTLAQWAPDGIVADEGHYAKSGKQRFRSKVKQERDEDGRFVRDEKGNIKTTKVVEAVSGSARASAVLNLANVVAKNRGLVLALTGTPIVNRPVELAPLLEVVGVLHLYGGSTQYKQRYCGPTAITVGGIKRWNYNGSSNLLELNTRLSASGHYVRRTKQALVDSGALPRKFVDGVYCYDYTTPARPWLLRVDGTPLAPYLEASQDATEFFTGVAVEIARKLRAAVTSASVQKKVAAEGHRHLKRLSELRLLAGQIKVPYVINEVQKLVDRGEKVVIAAHHREVVDAYADAFTGLKIQGDMGVRKIEEAKALFNGTPASEHPVLVLSVEAGKTGHTLCKQSIMGAGPACAHMVFAEQVWTPGDETQAQDRIWRIGQDREVRIINALLAGTIDEDIYGQRAKKRAVVNAAVDAIDPEALETGDRGLGRLAVQFVRDVNRRR